MLSWRKKRLHTIGRRNMLLLGGYGLATSLIGMRLYWLQIREGENYARLGEKNRLGIRFLTPERGMLLDRKGEPLATNEQIVRLSVVPEYTQDLRLLLEKIAGWVSLDDEKIQQLLAKATQQPSFVPILVESKLAWEQVMPLAVRAHEMPGVLIDGGFRRYYAYGEMLCHVLGYVGQIGEVKEESDRLFLRLPDVQVGKTGMERVLDKDLRGRVGFREVENNAFGREVREIRKKPSIAGKNVHLTIDFALQRFMHLSMRNVRAGGAILVDPWSGAVRAMVSKPDYDPNVFSRILSVSEWENLQSQKPSPLINRVFAQHYSPGSVFKLVVMLAALEMGISPQKTYTCKGFIEVGDDKLHCWKKTGHGRLNMVQAVSSSCDVWFYEVMKEIGLERVMNTARKLGFGQKVGDENFPFEQQGFLPSKAWKQERIGQSWTLGDSLVASIGQGYTSVTVAQMALMMSRLLTKGVTPHLHLVEERQNFAGITREQGYFSIGNGLDYAVEIDASHQESILKATRNAVNHSSGTAYRLRLQQQGFSYAGKTGTSQVRNISAAEREEGVIPNEELPWHLRDHSVFVGYAPVHAPRYVMAIVVEHGGSSSRMAVPIARENLLRVQAGFDYGLDT